jgi:hypothetical protein
MSVKHLQPYADRLIFENTAGKSAKPPGKAGKS